MTNYSLTRLAVSQNDSWFHQLPNECCFEPSNVSLPTDLFSSTFRSHQRGAFQESITISHSKNHGPISCHGTFSLVPGFRDLHVHRFPPKISTSTLAISSSQRTNVFFLKHRKLYISWFFSPRKNLGILLLEHNSNPTFFPPKNHPKSCGLPSGGPTGFTPLLGYPNHFASRQLKWCRPQREAQRGAMGGQPIHPCDLDEAQGVPTSDLKVLEATPRC